MNFFQRTKNRLIAIAAARSPALARKLVDGYRVRAVSGDIPWSVPRRPLHEARLALVTTAGIHHPHQPPFDMHDRQGDPSFRPLNGATLFDDFVITHDYYDHRDARRDPNIILPLDRLRELVAEEVVGSLAATHYAFMGHIDGEHIRTLQETSAPQVVQRMKEEGVDLVLLTPA